MLEEFASSLWSKWGLAALLFLCGCSAPPSSPGADATVSKIDLATAHDVLGLTGRDLQRRLGRPDYTQDYGNDIAGWGYAIESCPIEYQLRNGAVGAFQVRLQPGCRPTFRGIEGLETANLSSNTTFLDLASRLKGDWRSICLQDCVDPSPPTISYYIGGAERQDDLEIIADAQTSAADAASTAQTWRRALNAELGNPDGAIIPFARYGCGLGAQAAASEAMAPVRVQAIAVGSSLNPGLSRCSSSPPRPKK